MRAALAPVPARERPTMARKSMSAPEWGSGHRAAGPQPEAMRTVSDPWRGEARALEWEVVAGVDAGCCFPDYLTVDFPDYFT